MRRECERKKIFQCERKISSILKEIAEGSQISPSLLQNASHSIPSAQMIYDFCYRIFHAEDIRAEVIILIVHYVERLIFK